MVFLRFLLFVLGLAALVWAWAILRGRMHQYFPGMAKVARPSPQAWSEMEAYARQVRLVGIVLLVCFFLSLFMDHFFSTLFCILVDLGGLGLAGYQIYKIRRSK